MENKKFVVTSTMLASQGERFLNYIIDFAIQYIVALIIGATAVLIAQVTNWYAFSNWIANMNKFVEYFFGIVITLLYYALMEIYFSRTIAKYFTKTLVVMDDGSKPNVSTIVKRTLCRLIPFEALTFLGADSRGWHDTLSETYVVKKHKFNNEKQLFDSFDEIGKSGE